MIGRLMGRKLAILSIGLFSAANVGVIFGAHAAVAQSFVWPPLVVPSSPTHCSASNLNGVELMKMIHAVIVHGDLGDVSFNERTFGTKFRSSMGWTVDGKPDPNNLNYLADKVLGSPIRVTFFVDRDKTLPFGYGKIIFLRIESRPYPDAQANYIASCLRISGSDFSSYFGGGFMPTVQPPGAPNPSGASNHDVAIPHYLADPVVTGGTKTFFNVGRASVRISLVFSLAKLRNGDPNNVVTGVLIKQYK